MNIKNVAERQARDALWSEKLRRRPQAGPVCSSVATRDVSGGRHASNGNRESWRSCLSHGNSAESSPAKIKTQGGGPGQVPTDAEGVYTEGWSEKRCHMTNVMPPATCEASPLAEYAHSTGTPLVPSTTAHLFLFTPSNPDFASYSPHAHANQSQCPVHCSTDPSSCSHPLCTPNRPSPRPPSDACSPPTPPNRIASGRTSARRSRFVCSGAAY